MRLVRVVHMSYTMVHGPITAIVPDVTLTTEEVNAALAFVDADGEAHIYPLTDELRRTLIDKLSGGVIIPAAPLT